MPQPLLVRARRLITLDPSLPDVIDGWFAADTEGRISAVGQGEPDPTRSIDGSMLDAGEAIVAPGFISAHSHLFTSGIRGMAHDQWLYGWSEVLGQVTRLLTAEDIYWLARHGAMDFLSAGITTAYDFTHSGTMMDVDAEGHPTVAEGIPDVAYGHAQLKAKIDAGLRHIHSVGLGVGPAEAVRDYFEAVVGEAAPYAEDPHMLGLAISGAVQRAKAPSVAEIEAELMHEFKVTNHAHLLETPQFAEEQRARIEWYRVAGALTDRFVFGHFVQATTDLIALAAKHGCAVSWQPSSNGRLASGVADIPAMRACGIRVGIGLDDQSCSDIADPFANMRIGTYVQRAVHKDPQAMPIRDVLMLHTRGGAEALGIDEHVGSLRLGRFADFLVVDPTWPDTGPVWDTLGTYVLACGLRNLRQVYVGGELVCEGPEVVKDRERQVRSQVHARLRRLMG